MKNVVIEDISMGKPPPKVHTTKVVLGIIAILKIEDNATWLKIEDETM